MLNILRQPNKKFILRNCLLLSTVCAGLLNSNTSLAADYDYVNTSTPYGKVGAYLRKEHNQYNLTISPTGVPNEKSITINDVKYYFVPNEEKDDRNKAIDYLLIRGLTEIGSSSDYTFKAGDSYYNFYNSGDKNTLGVIILDGTPMEYDYSVAQPNGTVKYYRIVGNIADGTTPRVANITQSFIHSSYGGGNKYEGSGGKVSVKNGASIPMIETSFNNGRATENGGALYIPTAYVDTMLTQFTADKANNGGGFYNEGDIRVIISDFYINEASSNGGAFYNSGQISDIIGYFNSNSSGQSGGAIYNSNSITSLSGNFNGNIAGKFGGAIYNEGVIGLLTQSMDIDFYNNEDSTGYNDIYGGIYNLNAKSEYKINFGGSIKNTTLNINNDSSAANRGGDYVFNNTVDAGVNLYNGANVKLANINQVDGTTSYGVINTSKTMTVDNVASSNIDMRNNHIDTNTVGGLTLGSNLGLGIDTSLRRHSTSTSDRLISTATATGDGKMVINAINLTNSTYGEGDSMKVSIADDKTKGKIAIADDILDNITGATNYYTKVEYDENTGDLVFTDKLVNKSTLDQALQDAGIADMSVYAKTEDVYNNVYTKSQANEKFATIESLGNYVTSESLGTTLGGYVTTGGLNTALTPYAKSSDVAETYATKDSITDMLTKTEANSTYATKTSVYTKDEANETFAVKGSSYTKSEIDETLGGYVTTGGLNTALTPYAKSSDVAETYATKEALTTELGNKVDTSDFNEYKTTVSDTYATKSSLNDYAKTSDLSDYAKSSDLGAYAKTSDIAETYATKNELGSYAKSSDVADTYATKGELTTGLGNKVDTSAFNEYKTEVGNTYAKSDAVYSKNDIDTKLGGYVKSDDLSTTLSDYAKTEDLGVYAKTADIESNYATKEALNDYATKASLNDYVKSDALDGAINSKLTDYAKTSDLSDYAKTSDLGSYVKSSDLDSTLSGYAKTSDISNMLTKTEAGNTYATKASLNDYATKTSLNDYVKSDDVYSKNDMDTKLGGYVTSDNLDTKLGSYVKSDDLTTTLGSYAKTSDLDAYAKTADIESTYATKASLNEYVKSDTLDSKLSDYAKSDDVYSKNDIDTKLGGYVTSDNLDTKLGSYVKSDDLTTTLGSYAKTEDIANTYATKDELDGKVDTSAFNTYKTEVGNTYATKDELGNKADVSTVTALQTTVSDLSDTVAGKANQSDLETLQTTVAGKANAADVYTKDEADNKYATQNAISDMLTKTEAGNTYATQSALNDYKTSNDNAVSALTGKMTQVETDISGIKGSAVMSSGITAEKVAAYEGYAALIDAKQDALSTEQMAVLNSGITAADIATVQTANARLDAMDTTVADLSADFGDVADFSNSKTGNLKNDVPSSSKPNASTVTKAIANMDATIGQIHGLAAKVGVENGGANLGQNTTVEEHVTALAGAIGNRTHYTQQNYIKNNQTVAQSLDNLDIAVGSIKRDFTSAQIANEARFNDIEHNINHLENKMEKGLAANNALAALKPLSSTYQTQLSAAMGGYENNQAFAIGGFHYVTEKVLLNTGVAYGGNNSMSYNVGVTFGF